MLCRIVHFYLPNKDMPGLELLVVVISTKKRAGACTHQATPKNPELKKQHSLQLPRRMGLRLPAGGFIHCWLHVLHLEICHVKPMNQHSGVVALGDRPRLYLQLENLLELEGFWFYVSADLVASWHTFYLHNNQNKPYCGLGLQNLDHRGDYICSID